MFESSHDRVPSAVDKFKTYATVLIVAGLAYFAITAGGDQGQRDGNTSKEQGDDGPERGGRPESASDAPPSGSPERPPSAMTQKREARDPQPASQRPSESKRAARDEPTIETGLLDDQKQAVPTPPAAAAESPSQAPSVARRPESSHESRTPNKTLPPRLAHEITQLRHRLRELGQALDEVQTLTERIDSGRHPEIQDFGRRLGTFPAFELYKEYRRREEARSNPLWNRERLETKRKQALSRLDNAQQASEPPELESIRRFLANDAFPVFKRRDFLRNIVKQAKNVLAPAEKRTAAERYKGEQEAVERFIESGPLQPFLGTGGKATYWWLFWSRLAAGVDPETGRLGREQSEDYLMFHMFVDNMAKTVSSVDASRYPVTARRTYELWKTFRLVVDYRPDVFKRVVKWDRPDGTPFRDRFPVRVRRPNGFIEEPPHYLLGKPSPPSTARRRVMAAYRSWRREVQRRFFPHELP